ncbi:MAG: class I SAM-dependent methyltransferase [Fimbriimonas sp.]
MEEKKGVWASFFDAHASNYDENGFTKNTEKEVDFFLGLYGLKPGAKILDVGCGTGRHSVELARRGFKVTGLDISAGMLFEAQRKAERFGVEVTWVLADATKFTFPEKFDAAICLCEGAMGLIEQGMNAELHDLEIMRNIADVLEPAGPFLLTALNAYATIRQMKDEFVVAGRFDPATMVSSYQDEWDLPGGSKVVQIYERLFIPPEMARMLKMAGFDVLAIYGGTAGAWAQRSLSLDEVEAMYVCRRKG